MTDKVRVSDLAQLIYDFLDESEAVYKDPEDGFSDVGVEGLLDIDALARKIADEANSINRGWVWL